MNLETLLLVLAMVLVAVFNVILPSARKRQEDARAGNAEPELLAASPAPVTEFGTRRNAPTGTTAPMASGGARPRRRLLGGSLSGVRNGIVLAAVLGPCRAQTPFV